MRAWIWTTVARLRTFLGRRTTDTDFDQELDTHLTMAVEEKVRAGMSPPDARRAARLELGGVAQLKEDGRALRGLPGLDTLWLDAKLGLRLLVKSWGLTLVGGLAMTTAHASLVGFVNTYQTVFRSRLPFEDGERVVVLMTHDPRTAQRQPTPVGDLVRWRDTLRSVEDIGAFRAVERNLTIGDGSPIPVPVAEMTAAGFRLPRVAPALGRPLLDADERSGAEPVVVIGDEVWRTRFASDPSVVGRQLRLSGIPYTVVGVMPDGFEFPIHHQFWIPLRAEPSADARDAVIVEPPVFGFGRLAPGRSLDGAQAELAAVGLLPAADVTRERNESEAGLEPRVLPYTFGLTGATEGLGRQFATTFLFIASLLFLPPVANIAILVYARTVARQEEFAARFALGATRLRLVGQLFVEMLVLAGGAAIIALGFVRLTGDWLQTGINLPNGVGTAFWMDFGALSAWTVILAVGLSLLAAAIAGVLPALQAMSRLMPAALRTRSSGAGAQLGITWTVLIVAQVAIAIVVLPSAVELAWGSLRQNVMDTGFATREFLAADLGYDPPRSRATSPAPSRSFPALREELTRRLATEAGIQAVTFSTAAPGLEPQVYVEMANPGEREVPGLTLRQVRTNDVETTFFETFGVRTLTGRTLGPGDESAAAAVVNRTFVEQLVGDRNPLGERFRYREPGVALDTSLSPWHEIVGVVEDFPANSNDRIVYHPLSPDRAGPVNLTLHLTPGSDGVARRLGELVTALDPALTARDVASLDERYRQRQQVRYVAGLMIGGVTLSVLLLSAAGVYALTSFTVVQRRREIGIRSALGAQPRRLLTGVFKRALGQLGAGVAVGVVGAVLLREYLPLLEVGGRDVPGVLAGASALLIAVGLLAATGPARRALRVDPTVALRDGE